MASPNSVIAQFGVPRQTLSVPPRAVPERLVARVAGGGTYPAIAGRTSAPDSMLVIGVEGTPPAGMALGFGVLLTARDGTSRGVMLFDGVADRGRAADRHRFDGHDVGAAARRRGRRRRLRGSRVPALPRLHAPVTAARIAVCGIVREWAGQPRTGVNAAYVRAVVAAGGIPLDRLAPGRPDPRRRTSWTASTASCSPAARTSIPALYREPASPGLGPLDRGATWSRSRCSRRRASRPAGARNLPGAPAGERGAGGNALAGPALRPAGHREPLGRGRPRGPHSRRARRSREAGSPTRSAATGSR